MKDKNYFETYFGTELHISLIKNINDETSLIAVAIPDVNLKFFKRCETEVNIDIIKYLETEPEDKRFLYKEEVELLQEAVDKLIDLLEDKKARQTYSWVYELSEDGFFIEDIKEILSHLNHLCKIALKGHKILHISANYDDTDLVGE